MAGHDPRIDAYIARQAEFAQPILERIRAIVHEACPKVDETLAFYAFSPSHQREYIEWLTEAKREETRQKRLLQAVDWLAEGKPRNWKYLSC